MSDNSNTRIRQKALRAARAVTMGAALVAAGCSSDAEEPRPTGGWDVAEKTDAQGDTSPDVADVADVAPDVIADTGPTCSGTSDQLCPETCDDSNDIDCCEADGLCDWYEGGCGCAVPGPFTPPSMVV
jgi:hypothetical protein